MPGLAAPPARNEQGEEQAMHVYTDADLYDVFCNGIEKDFAGQAGLIADLVRRARPHGRTLLDVACGTGEHARYLSEVHGFEVDGIDLSPEMLAKARAKCPRGRFEVADLTRFHLGRRYDGLFCMSASIAYTVTIPRLREAMACMRDHLEPGGVALVQPYLTPDAVPPLGTREYTVEYGDVRIKRIRRSEIDGRRHLTHFHYIIEGPGGTREVDEVDDFGLFTIDEMLASFSAVGLAATYDPSWSETSGDGLYVASAPRG
jgi:ubiquinone/menaquinone biosynthesis C-methylase UbiE